MTHVAAEVMARAKPLARTGGDRRSEAVKDQADDVSLKHGNSADYLAARITHSREAPLGRRFRFSGGMDSHMIDHRRR